MRFPCLRTVAFASSAVLAVGCATAPGQSSGGVEEQLRQTFASDDPCSNNARNIGIAGGVLLGLLVGNKAGDGKTDAMATGALAGGLLGGLIGSDIDRRRCKLSKVAKKYDLDMIFSTVDAQGEVKPGSEGQEPAAPSAPHAIIGTAVELRDKDGVASHFESGSDKLTPRAQEYFSAIAEQYGSDAILNAQADPKRKGELEKQLAQRRLLLVGHTDDTGSSQLNADLSERRARAVASFMKQKGLPENAIYFQGAGEAMPTADNRTESGRAANRRVEIVEVADESGFKKFLAARKPNYAYYRPKERTAASASDAGEARRPESAVAPNVASATGAKSATSRRAVVNKPATSPGTETATSQSINFGGIPYQAAIARLDVGSLIPEKSGFSLISKAHADDSVLLSDCTQDRPRAVGSVKSLRDGSPYRTSEHLPQLFGKTWATDVNGNLVVINHLAVLRDGGAPANLPELKVYAQYKPDASKKPNVSEEPAVNSYLVDKGVLYRLFPRGGAGLKCIDILFATDGSKVAKGGKLIYASGSSSYVADFKPQLQ